MRNRTSAIGSILMIVVTVALVAPNIEAQDRGLVSAVAELGGTNVQIGRQYAVLIAIDRYREWSPLRNPVRDARAIKQVLDDRYYIDEFIELYDADATAVGIRRLFADLIDHTEPFDSVLIYYAGHGYTDRFDTGFWIPVDGSSDVESQDRSIPNQQIRNFISQMRVRSVALFVDSCFSGDLLNIHRGAMPTVDSEYFRRALRYNARQVITSGASETVPDESEFARQLLTFLQTNREQAVDPYAVYDRVRRGVTQTLPLIGTLPGQEDGGSFVLFLRDAIATAGLPAGAAASQRFLPGSVSAATGEAELMVRLAGAPAGVEVYVNGRLVGEAPSLFQALPAGVPLVVEARSGFDAARVELSLEPRELREITLNLERMKGNLFVESTEREVELFLDGVRIGPLGEGLFRGLEAGERKLELKGRDLYFASQVTIPGNETARVSARVAGIGSIRVDAPAGATVRISGGGITRTLSGPGTIPDLPAGTYSLSSGGAGFESASTTLTVTRGAALRWTPYTTGTLRFQQTVPGATLAVNGREHGAIPSRLALSPGSYRLSFQAPGYHESVREVEVAAGRIVPVDVPLRELARATLEIPNPPFGASIRVGDSTARVAAASPSIVIGNLRAGVPVEMSVEIPFADALDPSVASREVRFDEGARSAISLPSGRFSLPWLPEDGKLYFTPRGAAPGSSGSVEIPLDVTGTLLASPLLAAGSYTVRLTGAYQYTTTVRVEPDAIIELPGYRDTMASALTSQIREAERKLAARTGRVAAAIGPGIGGAAATAVAYVLGAQAKEAYDMAQSIDDVFAARKKIELWGTVLPIAASIGGVGFGLSPVLFAVGPNPKELRRSVNLWSDSLRRLTEE